MKKVLFAIGFILFGAVSTAHNVDSLLRVLNRPIKHDSAYALTLSQLAIQYEILGEYEKSISCCRQLNTLSDSLHYKHGLQASYNTMGNCYIDKGDCKNALQCHLKALKVREEMGNKNGVAYSHLNIGNIYFRLGDNDNAIKSYMTSYAMMDQLKDTRGIAIALSNMGSAYS